MVEVIPAILEKDFPEIEKRIHLVEGLVDWVQIDIADETLVPNKTFLDPEPFTRFTESLKDTSRVAGQAPAGGLAGWSGSISRDSPEVEESTSGMTRKLELELHMMVRDPLRYLDRFAKVGFKRFFAHIEGDYVEEYLEEGRRLGIEIGLAVDGPTPFEKIQKYLDNLDVVLVMAIEAGFSGRPFREDTIEKIRKIREVDLEIPISVDGAMIPENARKVVETGATRINSNSYIFQAEDIKQAIETLKNTKSF